MARGGAVCKRCVRKMWVKTAIGGLIAVECTVAAAYFYLRTMPKTNVVVEAENYTPPPPQPAAIGPTGWLYFDTKDSLIGDVTHHARILSNRATSYTDNKPIEGAVAGTLELANSTHYGQTVLLTLPPTKAACEANPCSLRASFDQSPPQTFPFMDISDDQHRILAIGDYNRFSQQLSRAHDLTLTASLGTPQDTTVTFTVSGYRLALWRAWRWAAAAMGYVG